MMESSLKRVQDLINQALATDDAAAAALQSMQGASVGVHCLSPSLSLWMQIDQGQVQLGRWPEPSDVKPVVSIRGKAADLVRLGMRMADQGSADLSGSGVSIEGDVGVLLQISRTFERLDIDWEYLLARLVGEKPARFACMGLSEAGKMAPGVKARSLQMGNQLVSRFGLLRSADVEAVGQQLRDLQYRIDRVQARISQLEQDR